VKDGKNNTDHPVDEAGVEQEEKEPVQIEQNEKEKRTKTKKKTKTGRDDEGKKKEANKSKKKLETAIMVDEVAEAKENGNTPTDQAADIEKSVDRRQEDASHEKESNR